MTKKSLTYRKLIGRPIVIVHASERTGNCPKCTAAIDGLKIAPAHMHLRSRLFRDPAICSESRHQSRPRTRRMTACWDLYGNVILTTNKVAKKEAAANLDKFDDFYYQAHVKRRGNFREGTDATTRLRVWVF